MPKKILKKQGSLTHGDLDKIADVVSGLLDKGLAFGLAPVATKKDLQELKIELKTYAHEGVETIMAELDRIEDMLTEKEEVEKLKIWAAKVSAKIGIKV